MKARILTGDMRETLKLLPDNSIDAIVTDPPYGLSFMGKRWDHSVPGPEYFRELLRLAKPGAHIVAFSGARTGHRLACALEDAGWELRDCLMWLYGSGFPKSHDVSKAIDKEAGAERTEGAREWRGGQRSAGVMGENLGTQTLVKYDTPATPEAAQWQGWGTALKPAWEPIYLARKPFDGTVASNVLEHGTGAINVDACRVGTESRPLVQPDRRSGNNTYQDGLQGSKAMGTTNVGRWPANLCLDETAAAMLDEQTGVLRAGERPANDKGSRQVTGARAGHAGRERVVPDSGGASRFFYVAKASRSEREKGLEGFAETNVNDGRATSIDNAYQRGDTKRANIHPTVKPITLMQWLIKLITPPGGIVLDPFNGSGSTGCAAVSLGFRYIGCELNPEYVAVCYARMKAWAK